LGWVAIGRLRRWPTLRPRRPTGGRPSCWPPGQTDFVGFWVGVPLEAPPPPGQAIGRRSGGGVATHCSMSQRASHLRSWYPNLIGRYSTCCPPPPPWKVGLPRCHRRFAFMLHRLFASPKRCSSLLSSPSWLQPPSRGPPPRPLGPTPARVQPHSPGGPRFSVTQVGGWTKGQQK